MRRMIVRHVLAAVMLLSGCSDAVVNPNDGPLNPGAIVGTWVWDSLQATPLEFDGETRVETAAGTGLATDGFTVIQFTFDDDGSGEHLLQSLGESRTQITWTLVGDTLTYAANDGSFDPQAAVINELDQDMLVFTVRDKAPCGRWAWDAPSCPVSVQLRLFLHKRRAE